MFLLIVVIFGILWQLSTVHSFVTKPNLGELAAPSRTLSDRLAALHSYVPDGLSAEEYEAIKARERARTQGKDLGRIGPKGFQSRSLQAWQVAYENGQASHLFAPVQYQQQLKQGILRKSDVPYMVRGGSWDNADLKGAKRLPWSKLDRDYAKGGYKKEQSASILGSGPGLDWTGSRNSPEMTAKRSMPGFS